MRAAFTPGPLTVNVSDKRPHYIVTTDLNGVIRFSTPFPCHSSEDKSANDTIECRHFKASEREQYAAINRHALADEVVRAAAPELLEALKNVSSSCPDDIDDRDGAVLVALTVEEVKALRAAIAKAEGGAA